jgi:hypothetical protein
MGADGVHPRRSQRAERAQPGVQLGEPGGRRGERLDAEHSTVGVQRSGDVLVRMGGSTPPVIRPVSTMVIAIPSQFKWVKGWDARPGNETVPIGLRLTADRSPSPNGACPYLLTDPADTKSSDRTAGRGGGGSPSGVYPRVLTGHPVRRRDPPRPALRITQIVR